MYGFDRRWLNKNAIVLFENIGMWKKMSGFVSLFLCVRIHSFVRLNGCSVLVCLAQSPIFSTLTSQAHGREIADKSVISCVAVLRVLHACGAANGINYDFPLCTAKMLDSGQNIHKKTHTNIEREKESGRDTCKRCGSMAEIMSFQ